MLITQRGLIKRLLDDHPEARARCARRYLLTGDRHNWRRLMDAEWLAPDQRGRIQRTLLDLVDEAAAGRIIERLDRYHSSWQPFIAALVRRHAGALKPRLQAMLRERHPARVTIGVVGLAGIARRDPEAAQLLRGLIVSGAQVEDRQPIQEAVAELGRLADAASVRLLSQLCRSPDAWYRGAAAEAMAASRSRDAIRALLTNAADDPDLISAAVAALLARRVDVAGMMDARDPALARVALAVFRALVAGLGDSLDVALLPRLGLVEQARALLARYVARPLAPVVEAVLETDEALAERWWPAYRARRRRSPPQAAQAAPPDDDLGKALGEVQALIDEVKPLDRPIVVRALVDGLDDPEETYVRRSVMCLGRLGNETAVEPLVDLLPNSWGRLRREVIWALGRIGTGSAAGPLVEVLRARLDERSLGPFEHTAEERQEMAEVFQALCRLRGGVPLWVFRSALSEADAETRRAAAEGLARGAKARDRDAVDLLVATVQRDRSTAVRAAAAAALGHAPGDAADVLLGVLKERSGDVRRAAVRSLGLMRALVATDRLRTLLREPELEREAALALGRIMRGNLPRRVLHTLIEMANDPVDPQPACAAVEALAHFDIYEAQIALEHLAKDPATDPVVRAAAEHARWNRTRSP